MPYHFTHSFICLHDGHKVLTSELLSSIPKLPESSRKLLYLILPFLYVTTHYSSTNLMSIENVSIVFGPTIFRTDEFDFSKTGTISDLTTELIQNIDKIDFVIFNSPSFLPILSLSPSSPFIPSSLPSLIPFSFHSSSSSLSPFIPLTFHPSSSHPFHSSSSLIPLPSLISVPFIPLPFVFLRFLYTFPSFLELFGSFYAPPFPFNYQHLPYFIFFLDTFLFSFFSMPFFFFEL